jgi:tetratricopeptide (TPR) repeat protein
LTILLLGVHARHNSRSDDRVVKLIKALEATFPELRERVVSVPAYEPPSEALLIFLPPDAESSLPVLHNYVEQLGPDYDIRKLAPEEMPQTYDFGNSPPVIKRSPSAKRPQGESVDGPRSLLRLGFVERALSQLSQVVARSPQCVDAFELLVQAQRKLGQLDQAYTALKQGLSANLESGRFHELLGSVCVELSRHERAIHHLQEAIRLGSSSVQPYLLLAEIFTTMGAVSRVRASLEEALLRDPCHPDALISLGSLALEEGQLLQASETLRKALQQDPTRQDCRLKLGWCYLHQGFNHRAEVEFIQVSQGSDSAYHLAARFSLGRLYILLGNHQLARTILEHVSSSHPELAEPHYLLGLASSRLGESEQALRHWRTLIKLQPEREAELLPHMALDLSRSGRHQNALKTVRKAVRELGPRPDLIELQATIHMGQAQWSLALECLRQAESQDPESSSIAFELGWVYENLQDLAAAEQAYRKTLRLNPAAPEAFLGLGRLHVQQQRFDVAAVLVEKAAELSPLRADIWDEIGWIELLQGQYGSARGHFKQASRLDCKEPLYAVHLATAHYHLGEIDDARTVLESLGDTPSVGVLADFLTKRLEEASNGAIDRELTQLPAEMLQRTRLAQRPLAHWRSLRQIPDPRLAEKGDRSPWGKASA